MKKERNTHHTQQAEVHNGALTQCTFKSLIVCYPSFFSKQPVQCICLETAVPLALVLLHSRASSIGFDTICQCENILSIK